MRFGDAGDGRQLRRLHARRDGRDALPRGAELLVGLVGLLGEHGGVGGGRGTEAPGLTPPFLTPSLLTKTHLLE